MFFRVFIFLGVLCHLVMVFLCFVFRFNYFFFVFSFGSVFVFLVRRSVLVLKSIAPGTSLVLFDLKASFVELKASFVGSQALWKLELVFTPFSATRTKIMCIFLVFLLFFTCFCEFFRY